MDFVITPPRSPVLFDIFDFQIRYYGVIMAFSIFLGIFLAYFLIKKTLSDKQSDFFLDKIPYVVFFSIVGARLFYVVGDFGFYLNNPKEIIMLNHGGLSIWGAIIFGILAVLYFFKDIKNKNLCSYFDIFAICLPLSQSIGRWGNFFNQEAYGAPLDSFIKLYVDYKYRYQEFLDVSYYHPAFLYESFLDFILFLTLIVLFFKTRKSKEYKDGTIFYLYLIFYSIIRIIVESVRIDSILYLDFIPVAQIISFFVLVISSFLLFIKYQKK